MTLQLKKKLSKNDELIVQKYAPTNICLLCHKRFSKMKFAGSDGFALDVIISSFFSPRVGLAVGNFGDTIGDAIGSAFKGLSRLVSLLSVTLLVKFVEEE